ncbi:hypothetical protein ACLRCI_001881 [Campylobacter coli]|nr:hypothetical protein [Campylobacter coli]
MKNKILFFLLFFANSAFACLCTGYINSSYSKFQSHIQSKLNNQVKALKELQKSIDTNIQTIKEQIIINEKDNKILENNLLENKRIIFELSKENQIR